jgi:hypothetical protein
LYHGSCPAAQYIPAIDLQGSSPFVPSSDGEDICDLGAQSVVHPTGLRVNGDSCIRAIVRWVEESLRPRLFARVVCQLTCHALFEFRYSGGRRSNGGLVCHCVFTPWTRRGRLRSPNERICIRILLWIPISDLLILYNGQHG